MRFLFALLLCLLPLSAAAQNRMALVIGNNSYSDVPVLAKARADAQSIGTKLNELGFTVTTALDQDRRGLNRKISEFTARLEPGDAAFVFFAGHGVEIDGENYLLPTDIAAPSAGGSDFVKSESIALSDLLDRVRKTGARSAVVIIDACRNNPFKLVEGRSIGTTRGLGRIAAPQGTFVIFSAGAGQLALDRLNEDDTAENSVFTRALLPLLSEPGLELRTLVAGLRREVRDLALTVQHSQVPAYYDEMLGEFYFTQAAVPAAPAKPAAAAMQSDFEIARSIGPPQALDSFLERYSGREDEYTYTVALQLRQGLATPQAEPEAPAQQAPEAPDVPVIPDSRQVMRETQAALNDIGCQAGRPDGIAGPRTRSAFAAYLAAADSTLGADDLGTAHALEELRQKSGKVCKTAPKPVSAPAPAASAEAAPVSLAGAWKYKATCALVLKVTGNVHYTHAGGNKYHGRLNDSLGQNANTEVYLNGQQLSGTDYFPGITVTWRGRLAEDGRSFTASGSTGCAVYAWR
ncbi:caspase family protein [Leisingera sp. McT4-56]|uniref:caspase family protein n=1 Tax=Leisingera sp. McT4-56 TaxID=2881255 RepID=UPI001CF8E39E|nr:caspase family protein [Leisingera sp. McT4-56]MCB4454219.1 caspase family protein [Leisingera sp. McT4-56]